jgi:hypothetical protein
MLRRLLDRQPTESQSWLFAFHPGYRERALAEIVDVALYGSLPEAEA